MPTPLFGGAATSDGTYAYVAGGSNLGSAQSVNAFNRYDPIGNTWTPLSPFPGAGVAMASAVYAPVNNKIYVFGGQDVDSGTQSNATRIYDPVLGTWGAGANLPEGRSFMASAYYNGKIYLVSGYNTGNLTSAQPSIWEYDPLANTFNTSLQPIPHAAGGAGSGVINGHLFVAGGRDATVTTLNLVYDYDIANNTWTQKHNLPANVNAPGSAVASVAINQRLWVFGGGNPFAFNTTFTYDPAADSWSSGPNLNVGRSFIAGTAVGDKLVAAGGVGQSALEGNAENTVATTEVLDLHCPTPTPTPVPCTYRVLIAYADSIGEPTQLQTSLLAEPGIAAVDLFDATTASPTLAQLQAYDEVVAFSNSAWFNATSMGDVLADYQDAGGIVVVTNFAFDTRGGWLLAGRWVTGGYTPLNASGATNFTSNTATITQPGAPLMTGITTLTATYREGVTLTGGAVSTASWTDGSPAVAYKTTAGHTGVALNAYLGYLNAYSGDWARLIANACRWLKPTGCSTPTPTPTLTPAPTCMPGTFTFEGDSATSGTFGNIRTFTAGGVAVNVSGFSRKYSDGSWSTSWLGVFDTGLGVTGQSEDGGTNNQHVIDNIGDSDDYVLFEFSTPLIIDQVFLDYIYAGHSNMTAWIGTKTDPFTNHNTLSDLFLTSLGAPEDNNTTSTDLSRFADINAANTVGNVLVIAASVSDPVQDDGFKVHRLLFCQGGAPPPSPTPGAQITVNPTSIEFDGNPGGPFPAPQSIQVTTSNGVPWTSSDNSPWFDTNPTSGLSGASATLTPHTQGLAAGTYTENITFSAPGCPDKVVVVTLILGPHITVAPTSIQFNGVAGGAFPAPQSIQVTASNGSAWHSADASPWFDAAPTSGASGTSTTLTPHSQGMVPGTYTQNITFSAAGCPDKVVIVTLVLTSSGPPVNISGAVSYCSDPAAGPVPNVTLTLSGSASGSAVTDGSGNYQLSSLASGGSYTVTPAKSALTPGAPGINVVDVVAVQRHTLNLGTPLTGCRLMAADVNGDNVVNTVDVIAIQRFYLNFSTGIGNTGKYKFNPASRTYPGVVTNQTGQNYDTLVFGDVITPFADRAGGPSQNGAGDGSSASTLSGLTTSSDEVPSTVAAVTLPNATVDASVNDFIAQVTTTTISAGDKLVGFQGDFTFDERAVTFQSEPVQKAGLTGGNWNVSGNVLDGPGPMRTLRVAGYSNDFTPLSGSGTLFELRMTRVSKAAQSTQLLWAAPPDHFIFIDADLKTQKPGYTASGGVVLEKAQVKPNVPKTKTGTNSEPSDEAPTKNLESGLAAPLPPGPYTVLLAGLNTSASVGLVEVSDRVVPWYW